MDLFFGLEQFDYSALHAIQSSPNPWLTAIMLFITFFGTPVFWVGIASVFYWRAQENRSFFLMNLVVFVSAIVGALKFAFARPRPSAEEFQVLSSDDYGLQGFPSGHSAMIAAAFSYSWKTIKKHEKALFAILVLLVAYSRLYLGMHYPMDVIAGLALGLVIGKANLFTKNKLFHRNFKPSKLEDEIALVATIIAALAAIFFFRSIPMTGLFIGYYAGFFLFKEMELKQSILLHKMLAIKYAIGFAVLLAIFLPCEEIISIGIALGETEKFALYAIAGTWISWIWPVLFEKAFRVITPS